MASRHILRSLPGHVATLVAVVVTTGLAVGGAASLFYEGWGQPVLRMLGYLVPAMAALLLGLVALGWPRAGGVLLLVGGLGAGGWWLSTRVQRGMAPFGVLLTTALMMVGPLVVASLLFLFEARHRRLLRGEGVPASPRWIVRNYGHLLLVGAPLAGIAILAVQQLPALLARHDDGLRGARIIEGNGVRLVWAPMGPGWNSREPDSAFLSWEALAHHGSPPRERCAYLNEEGTALLAAPAGVWRMPTADEIVRSLTRDGKNAGCWWDGRTPHSTCGRPPDKETPLWAPDQAPIYYWSSREADAATAFAVNYTGGLSVLPKSLDGVGFRCVKVVADPAPPDPRGASRPDFSRHRSPPLGPMTSMDGSERSHDSGYVRPAATPSGAAFSICLGASSLQSRCPVRSFGRSRGALSPGRCAW